MTMAQPQADGASLAPRDPSEPFSVAQHLAGAGDVMVAEADDAVAPSELAPQQAPREIATLPPIEELRAQQVPISAATGQPRRAIAMVVANVFLYGASLAALVALAWSWWRAIHVATFAHSSRLVELWQPRPGGWRSIVAVTLVFLIGAATAAAPAVAAFNSWNGHRWSRGAAVFATVLGCLGYLIGPVAWLVPLLSLVGAVILFLPPVTRYFGHWKLFRAGTPVAQLPDVAVQYGPLPRYR